MQRVQLNKVPLVLFCVFQAKLDKSHSGKPSRVIHIRNIPNEISEAEIIHLGLPFGRVTNVLVLKGKNQVRAQHYIYLQLVTCKCHAAAILNYIRDEANLSRPARI